MPHPDFMISTRILCRKYYVIFPTLSLFSHGFIFSSLTILFTGDEIQMGGGFTVRWTNILIGIQSSLIVLPVNILIVYLFRRAAPSKSKHNQYFKAADRSVLPRNRENRKEYFQSIEPTDSAGFGISFGRKKDVSLRTQTLKSPMWESSQRDSAMSFDDDSIFQIQQKPKAKQQEETSLDDVNIGKKA